MSVEDNKAIVVRWFTDFWGSDFDTRVIDELAAPDIRFEYSLHKPLRGRDEVREFATPGPPSRRSPRRLAAGRTPAGGWSSPVRP